MLDRTALAAALTMLIACSGGACGSARSQPSSARSAPPGLLFHEACDGSGAVLLTDERLLVANDEDNLLRVYDAKRGGDPLSRVDLDPALREAAKRAGEKQPKEADLEAAALLDGVVYLIGSHGRNASGKLRAERRSLLAVTHTVPPTVLGTPYQRLLEQLVSDPRYSAYALQEASERAPKDAQGLNIEGLAPRLEGGLWIGFRNPQPEGKALLAALVNPRQLLEGGLAVLAEPRLLGLDGLGVRDLARFRAGYLILAGSHEEGAGGKLFSWDGRGQPRALSLPALEGLNPEALAVSSDARRVLVLSDDGTRESAGTACKERKEGAQKSFRGVWLSAQDGW